MTFGVFEEFLLMLLLAAAAVALIRRLRLPGIVGYLLVGAVFGPAAIGLFPDPERMWFIAQLGVVFLLFTIGLEFSLTELNAMRRTLLPLGFGQVALTTAGIAAVALLVGFQGAAAFAVGAVLAQSSTSIISKQLLEQGEQTARHGRLSIGISLFQDVTAIPFVIAIPALAAGGMVWLGDLGQALALAVAMTVALWAGGRWLIRPLFHEVARARSLELFTLVALATAVGAAWLTDQAGLSLALGGFLAGLVLSESEFRHQVEVAIQPFRDILLGLFFITIGMQLDLPGLPAIAPWVIPLTVGAIAFKAALVWLLCRFAGIGYHQALRTGLILSVGGEFGFALIALSLDAGLLDDRQTQILLGTVLLSMLTTPLLIRYNLAIADLLSPVARAAHREAAPDHTQVATRDHVVLCGYGRIGQNIARFLEEERIPCVAMDLDPTRVRDAAAAGYRVHYGDGRNRRLLEVLCVADARLVVVTYDDLPAAERTVTEIRALDSEVPVLVRTRDDAYVERLLEAGATETVSETMEASLMLVSHVLHLSGIPIERVMSRMESARANRYRLLRELFADLAPDTIEADETARSHLAAFTLREGSPAIGHRLASLELREGVRMSALCREGTRTAEPDPDAVLQPGDVLLLYGPPDQLEAAERELGER